MITPGSNGHYSPGIIFAAFLKMFIMNNDNRNNNDAAEFEEIQTLINDGARKDSTAATINAQRLAQDDNFTVITQATEAKRNEEFVNESVVGAADQSKTEAATEVITLGDQGIDDQDDLGIVMGTEADVTEEDLALLGSKEQDLDGGEDEMLAKAGLDDTDFEGELLNEAATDMASTGDDLDMPDDDVSNPRTDALGQGDEENDYYSLGGDKDDQLSEDTD